MSAKSEHVATENGHTGAPSELEDNSQYINYKRLHDEIVISGFSGRLPESSTIEEFKNNLFNGIDMVNDDPRRWPNGLYDLPHRIGKIKDDNLEKFDLQFFSVHQKQAEYMDPQMRMLLEIAHEAIIDSGFNPQELRGSRTGVYVGVTNTELEQYFLADPDRVNSYNLIGSSRCMFANRLSFAFDFKGPSHCVDNACSSSLYAMSQAFADLKAGRCDAAIVAGTALVLNPTLSLSLKRLKMLNPEGKCRSFDEKGAGYVRSDSCVVVFLQKASAARRVYSTVLNVRSNIDGHKEQGIASPDGKMQHCLLHDTYNEIGLNPRDVVYVEAHGTGTKIGDPQEVNAITDFFCKNRKTPLLIGSVKSNIGHTESASGVCGIAKVLLAMEAGVIPGNLHYTKANPDLYGIVDGRVKVVDRNTPWNGGIIGLTSIGFGGVNVHLIMESNPKPKSITSNDTIPRLVVLSGRTKQAVDLLLDDIVKHKTDKEYLALINEIHAKNIPLYHSRGFAVVEEDSIVREVTEVTGDKRPIWYIYSGMGSQWASAAKDLMSLEVFRNSVNRCADVLRPEDCNLIEILTNSDEATFDHILNCYVAIVAVQVALTDVLTHLGIIPSGIVGHSFGELACAYADGCFTLEQTVLVAFWQGRAFAETDFKVKGMMAAVGLSWEDTKARLPSDIFAGCHNSRDSVTIAGPSNSVKKFIEKLNAEGIFAKAVQTCGYAFHSKYVDAVGPKALHAFERIITSPKNRTSRWLSTSIPESDWSAPIAQQCSAAYCVNNIVAPVLFHEAIQYIPKNAICIEIAPTGLLQSILKRAMGSNALNLSLLKRGHENNLAFFLSNIGKLYAAGAQPAVSKLYPISYPVGRGTPMLNSTVGWDHHSHRFVVPKIGVYSNSGVVDVNLTKEDDAYLVGHAIDGRVLFPASGYMTLAWRAFAKANNNTFDKMPVVLEDVAFHRATILPKDGSVKFAFKFLDSTGKFEICEGGSMVASGKIYEPENIDLEQLPLYPLDRNKSSLTIRADDIYKELRLCGYDYSGMFRGVSESHPNGVAGKLEWKDNWVSFIDTMLQFNVLANDLRGIYLPTGIERAVFNPIKHSEMMENLKESGSDVPVYLYKNINVIQSGGIEVRGATGSLGSRRSGIQSPPVLERCVYVPLKNANKDLSNNPVHARMHAVSVATHLAIENSGGALKVKVADVVENRIIEKSLAQIIHLVIESEPMLTSAITIFTNHANEANESYVQDVGDSGISVVTKDPSTGPVDSNNHLVVAYDVIGRINADIVLENLKASIRDDAFILLEENVAGYDEAKTNKLLSLCHLTTISIQRSTNKYFILLRRTFDISIRKKTVVLITEKHYKWVDQLKTALANAERENTYVYIVGQGEELLGAVGLMNCIKNEFGGSFARLIFIQDPEAAQFSFTNTTFLEQLNKDLISNVCRNGVWGTFRHLKLDFHGEVTKRLVEHAYVDALSKGQLSSLSWIQSPLSYQLPNPADKRVELCSVYYASVSLRDVMIGSGKLAANALTRDLKTQDVLGSEFAGRDSTGKRIMAMVRGNALATNCVAQRNMIWAIPSNWTMEQASTVPRVYLTAYYALIVRGKVKRGESILIHAGSGGVGQAAIRVALHHGLTIYTTVGSKEKREFLKKTFPQLTDAHIGNSRDTSFEQLVMQATQGRGVDLILNTLADEMLQASLRCLRSNGRFLQIEKFDFNHNSSGMRVVPNNSSFNVISLDNVIQGDDETIDTVVGLVADGIRKGAVLPLPTTVFSSEQVDQAFRFMASGKHIGKVVVKVRDEETSESIQPSVKLIPAVPRTYLHNEKSYVIVGGLGGFGLELANWLVTRGASKLVLASRSGVKTGYQSLMIRRWTDQGVVVSIDRNDVTTLKGAQNLLNAANKLGRVGGIFNLAAVLRDNLFENQTEADFETVSAPKVDGSKHLDVTSRDLCPYLDYFICFSSGSCGRGNIGQANYGLANSAMERICENRQACGLPGTAIQWGAIGDTGLVIDGFGGNDTAIRGSLPQRMYSCLQTMDRFMQQPHAVLSSIVVAEKPKAVNNTASLVNSVANILGLKDLTKVSEQETLVDMGLDSIMETEIMQTLERNHDVVLSLRGVRGLTFGKLKMLESEAKISRTVIVE